MARHPGAHLRAVPIDALRHAEAPCDSQGAQALPLRLERGTDGPRFENLVASHLLKWVHYQIDTTGREMELRYFWDVDGREVDFVVLENRKPRQLIEAKWNDGDVTTGLKYLKERFPTADAWQISATGRKDYVSREGIRVAPALELLRTLV